MGEKPDTKAFSFRADRETRERLKLLQESIGTGQKFGEAILHMATEMQLSEDAEQPASKEIRRVRGMLAEVRSVMEASLVLAETDKTRAQAEAREQIEQMEGRLREAKQAGEEARRIAKERERELTEAQRQIAILEGAAEGVAALKEAWEAREAALAEAADQVPDLEKRIRELEGIGAEQERQLTALRKERETLTDEARTKSAALADANRRIKASDDAITSLKERVAAAEKKAREDAHDREKAALVLKNRESEIRREMTDEKITEMQRYETETRKLNSRIQELMTEGEKRVRELTDAHDDRIREVRKELNDRNVEDVARYTEEITALKDRIDRMTIEHEQKINELTETKDK